MENGKWKMENETNQAGLPAPAGDVPRLPAEASSPRRFCVFSIFHSPFSIFHFSFSQARRALEAELAKLTNQLTQG
jgi:hypothetical protein